MNKDEILSLAGMPPGNPSYPHGPYRFVDRQYFNIIYESDPDAIRAMVPEPLKPDGSNTVVYEGYQPEYPISLVLYGQRAMPPFADLLDDEQVANVVDYLQSGLNDFEPTATVETVAANRPETDISGPQEEHE